MATNPDAPRSRRARRVFKNDHAELPAFMRAWWECFGEEPQRLAPLVALAEERALLAITLRPGAAHARAARLSALIAQAHVTRRNFDGVRVSAVVGAPTRWRLVEVKE